MRFPVKVIFAMAVVCGPKAVFAHDASSDLLCETRLMLQAQVEQKLGYAPVFESAELKPFTKAADAKRFMISAKHPRYGTLLAFFDYTLDAKTRTIEIEKVDVLNSNNARKGLANALFSEMIARHPQVERLLVTLGLDNLRLLRTAMASGADCAEAFQQTSIYKTVAHFGFTKVSGECNPTTREYKFVMELEPLH